jgi:choline dehydrogenase-like flavoprotein
VKKVGGNSLIWGGWCPRALESQFEMKTRLGIGEDWPIGYSELEPFYCRAEQELGVGGVHEPGTEPWRSRPYPAPPIERDYIGKLFADACARHGYSCERVQVARSPHPADGRPACHFCNVTNCTGCPTGARYSSEYHVRRALADRDVTLLTDTSAARLVVGAGGRIEQLGCLLPDRTARTIVAGTYVLAGNAIGNARLLLLSGAANRSGSVGRYYMGHPVHELLAELDRDVMAARSGFTVVSRQFEEGTHLRESAGFRMLVNGADRSPTLHGLRLVEQGLYGSAFKQAWKRATLRGIKAIVITDCLPRAENRIELDPEHRDVLGLPGLAIHYDYGEYEDNGRRLGMQTLRTLLEGFGVKHATESVHDMAHQIGTTRMGTDAAISVVDRDLRAHDIENLYVAGASVFPNALGPTNPTLTIAALSLRLADHLKQVGHA